jgi:CMP-N-acetylneuraminic acid synthetase
MLFVKKSTLEKMLDGVKNEYDSSTVVHKQKMYMWNSEGNPLYDINNIPNSFDLPDIISETMGLYVSKKKSILENSVRVSGNILLVDVDVIESTDINYEDDYLMSKSIANGLPYDSEYLEGVLELSKEYKKIKYG